MFVILCTDTYVRDETVLFHNVCAVSPWNGVPFVLYLLMSLLPAICSCLLCIMQETCTAIFAGWRELQ